MPGIAGQSILVIGGSSGIGFAVAQLAASQGATHVAIASSNPERVAAAVKRLESAGTQASFAGHTIDLGSQADIESRLQALLGDVTAGGTLLDHIVYTANKIDVKPLADASADYLLGLTQFPYIVPMLLGKLGPRYMNKGPQASLILTSGAVGERPNPTYTVMSPLAACLFGAARALALTLAPIRVNVVSPGATNTELWGPEEQRKAIAEHVGKTALLGRVGTPEEVAEAYIYLMKDTNNTGSTVSTSGGILLQ